MYKSEKFWDRMANKPVKKISQGTVDNVERIKNHLNKDDFVLDYACGNGTISYQLAGHVQKIEAIDISSKVIAIAKEAAAERKIKNIQFQQTAIFDERFSKESFDAILAFNILHLVEDREKVIQRVNELLRPGGIFISATVCLGGKRSFVSVSLSLLSKISMFPDIIRMKSSELEDLINNNNFQIIETAALSQSPLNYFIAAKKI